MEYEEMICDLKEKRAVYGVSQQLLAERAGITRVYLNNILNGKKRASQEVLCKLDACIRSLSPEDPLEILFDYVRIRFPTTDVKWVIQKLLRVKIGYMLHEEHAFYGYAEQCVLGDISVMFSPDIKKGVLLELKGKGCRQFERYLAAQNRSWFDFLKLVKKAGGIFKRIDLAINDRVGMIDIGELIHKCAKRECISVFRSFKGYQNGELTSIEEDNQTEMANGLYIGSMKSEVYFCVYAKDYEQYVKNGIPMKETETKNRFEIRLKNERAEHAIEDLITYQDAGRTAFAIINRYVRFVKAKPGKRRSEWVMTESWKSFVSMEDRKLKLTTAPEPYTIDRTYRWVSHQVAPTFKALMMLDEAKNTNIIGNMLNNTELNARQEKMIEQELADIADIIMIE